MPERIDEDGDFVISAQSHQCTMTHFKYKSCWKLFHCKTPTLSQRGMFYAGFRDFNGVMMIEKCDAVVAITMQPKKFTGTKWKEYLSKDMQVLKVEWGNSICLEAHFPSDNQTFKRFGDHLR
ncbi:unnamed protein product [Caenorhabditis brenneri]